MRKFSLSVIRGIELKIAAELTADQLAAHLRLKTLDSRECEEESLQKPNKLSTKAGNLCHTVEEKEGENGTCKAG